MNKQQTLRMKLDYLIPMNWMTDFSKENGLKNEILANIVELNPTWVEEVVSNLEHKLTDVLHDFRGIYSEDEHFLPRISVEDVMGSFDEDGDAVDVEEVTFDKLWDLLLDEGFATEEEMRLVCNINGTNIESLNSILYSRTGYRSMKQYKEVGEC